VAPVIMARYFWDTTLVRRAQVAYRIAEPGRRNRPFQRLIEARRRRLRKLPRREPQPRLRVGVPPSEHLTPHLGGGVSAALIYPLGPVIPIPERGI